MFQISYKHKRTFIRGLALVFLHFTYGCLPVAGEEGILGGRGRGPGQDTPTQPLFQPITNPYSLKWQPFGYYLKSLGSDNAFFLTNLKRRQSGDLTCIDHTPLIYSTDNFTKFLVKLERIMDSLYDY